MAENEKKNRELVPQPILPVVRGQHVRQIQTGRQDVIDVSNLPVPQQDILEMLAAQKTIERGDQAQRMAQDLMATASQIRTFTNAVADNAEHDAAVTITNTKDDALGRTEIMIGNTDAARTGKFSRSQQGFGDNAKLWILLAAIAGVVIVLVAAFHR